MENRVQYIIDLVVQDKQLRKQMANVDWEKIIGSSGKGMSDAFAKETKDATDKIKSTFHGLNIDWNAILGSKDLGRLEQQMAKVLSSSKKQISAFATTGDMSGIQRTVEYVAELGNQLKLLGSSFDAAQLSRGMTSFMKVLTPLSAKIDTLAKEPAKVEAAFDRLFNGVAVGANNTVKSSEKIFNIITKIETATKRTGGSQASLDKLTQRYKELSDLKFPDLSKLNLDQLEDKMIDLEDRWDALETRFKGKKTSSTFQLERGKLLKEELAIYNAINNIEQTYSKEITGDIETKVQKIITAFENAISKLQKQIDSDSFAQAISKQLSDVKISLSLPDNAKSKLINEVNNVIKSINQSPLETVKVDLSKTLDNSTNLIEDKQKRAYGSNEADDDVNTTKLVAQTEKRFDKITDVIKGKQNKILENTKTWRKDMLDQLKFKSGDFEFNFGDSLFQSLQSYLNEQGNELKFAVDQDTIKEQLKMVIENSGLTLGAFGGTANIDPNVVAKAVYNGVQAAITGQPISSFDTTSNSDSSKKERDSIADIVNSSDKYVKTITEKTINAERVIQALRDFALASTKKGIGRQNVAKWMTSRGIDISAINSGATDDAILTMLNESLMTKDRFGYAKGSLFADTLSDLKRFGITSGSKQETDVNNVIREIVEMLNRMGINQEYWQESQKRHQSYESYEMAAKYGRPIATIGKIRKPLYANSMKNFVDGGYKRLTDDRYIGNLNASVEYIDALRSEHLTEANREIDLAQQKAIILKEEFTELDKKSIEAKERLDKATAEYNRLKEIPEEQRTKQEKSDIINAKKESEEASKQYAWNKRDSEAKKKEYLRLVTYKDKEGNLHTGLIDKMKERRDAQKSVYDDAKSQITSFKDSILKLGENPAEEAIKALEQVARNFFEQSGKMLQNLFKYYGDKDTFQGRVTLQNGRSIDINSPYDFLGFKDDEVANVDVYKDILMKKWEKSKSVKKSIPQDFEIPSYYVSKPKPPIDIQNERIIVQDFVSLDEVKNPDLSSTIKLIENTNQQLIEDRQRTSDELVNLDNVIKSKEQETSQIAKLVNSLSEGEQQSLTQDIEKTKKRIVDTQNKQYKEQQEIDKINAEIFRTESEIDSIRQPSTVDDVSNQQNSLNKRIFSLENRNKELNNIMPSIYDTYKKATAQLDNANKAYNDYIEKLVSEEVFKSGKAGDIKKLAEKRNIGELEATTIFQDKFRREFNYSGRSDISELRKKQTEAKFAFNDAENKYNDISNEISNNKKLIEQLENERDTLTIEALQAEKDVVLQKKTKALAELKYQKKLAQRRLERAQNANQEAVNTLSDNVIFRQTESEKELNSLRISRDKLSNQLNEQDTTISSNEQEKERLELQSEYNQLKVKEINLQREINKLEDGEIKNTKQSELDAIRQKINNLTTKITSLGGHISQSQITEEDRKSYALNKAVEIQNNLMIAKAQKRAYESEIKEIEKLEENVVTGGLTSSIGIKKLNKFKLLARNDFINSDYYKDIRNQKKEKLNQDLASFASGKVTEDEINQKKKELWDALNAEMNQLIKEYIDSIKSNKGKVSTDDSRFKSIFSDFIANTDYSINSSGEVDLKQFILDELSKRKAIAKGESNAGGVEKQQYIKRLTDLINKLEQNLQESLDYGGLEKSELADSDLTEEIIKKTTNVKLNEDKRSAAEVELKNAINELSKAEKQGIDTKPFKSNVKEIKAEIQSLDELIDKENSEIENAKEQIALRSEEKSASSSTINDKLSKAEKRLQSSKEELITVKNEIASLEKVARDAEKKYGENSYEAEKARLNLLYKTRRQSSLENNIDRDEKRVKRWSGKVNVTDDKNTAIVNGATSTQGGIVGSIMSAINGISGDIQIDTTDLAKDSTLKAILEVLGGVPQTVDDGYGLGRRDKKTSDDAKSLYRTWNIKPQDLDFDTVKTKAVALKQVIDTLYDEGKSDTEEFINAQTELSKLLSAWRNKIGKSTNPELYGKTGKENWASYLTSGNTKIFDNLDNVELSSISQKDYLSRLKKIGVDTSNAKTEIKESEANLQIKDFDEFKLQVKSLKQAIELQEAGSEEQKKLQAALVQVLQAWAKNEASGFGGKLPNAKGWESYLISSGVFDSIDTSITPLTSRQLNKGSKTKNTTSKKTVEQRTDTPKKTESHTETVQPENRQATGGLLQLVGQLAKENTLLQVLNALQTLSTVEGGKPAPTAAGDLYNQFKALLLGSSIDDYERLAYMNSKDGLLSGNVIGNIANISEELINALRAKYPNAQGFDTQIHTHGKSNDPYFSDEDYQHFTKDYESGIKKQVLLTKDDISVLDLTAVESAEEVQDLMDELIKAGNNAEAIKKVFETNKSGAIFETAKFDSLNANSLVKMLGAKGINSNDTMTEINAIVSKLQTAREAMAQAINVGYLSKDDTNLAEFDKILDRTNEISESIKNGTTSYEAQKDELDKLTNSAIRYSDVINSTIGKNKRAYVGVGEVNSVNKQRDKIIGTFGSEEEFNNSKIELVRDYDQAVKNLNTTYKNLTDNQKIQDVNERQSLNQQATQVQALGKHLLSSISEAEKLKQLVDQSGVYKDNKGNFQSLGGSTEINIDNIKNLDTVMRNYVQNTLGQANIENVKFDATNQRLTYSFRTSQKTVADMVVQYDDLTQSLYAYQKQERESLSGLPGVIQGFKSKLHSILQYTASITSIYRVFGELKRGVQYVKEIDSALTELKKVTDETEATYDKFLNTAAKTADTVGSTISEVVSSTADWARLGYSLEDAANLAESTSVLLNVSEFQSIDDATSALVSTMQAFGYAAEDSMHVVDVMNEIGNNYAVSSDGIATALQDSASSLMAANNSYQEAVALIASANKVVQDPNSVGSALRTISLRLRGTSTTDLENAGEETDGAITSKSKLRSKIKGLSGIDILTDSGAYKSTYEIKYMSPYKETYMLCA